MEQGNQGGNTLQAFNRCVLHLGRLARERGAAEFIADGLQAFRQLVPFASAWWGEMSTSLGSARRRKAGCTGASTCLDRLPANGNRMPAATDFPMTP